MFPYQREDDALNRERMARMASTYPEPATASSIASGAWVELVLAAGGAAVAIAGLLGQAPLAMASLATIAIGAAMFAQGVALSARWHDLAAYFETRRVRRAEVGIVAQVAGGTLVVLAGALALARIEPLAGLFYLLTGGTAFAFFTRGKLFMERDAATAASNIFSRTNPVSGRCRCGSFWSGMLRRGHCTAVSAL